MSLLATCKHDVGVMDHPSSEPGGAWEDAIVDFIAHGGRVIHRYWRYEDMTGAHVADEASVTADIDTQPIYVWDDNNDGCTIYSGFLWDDLTSDKNGDDVTNLVGLVPNQVQHLLSADRDA